MDTKCPGVGSRVFVVLFNVLPKDNKNFCFFNKDKKRQPPSIGCHATLDIIEFFLLSSVTKTSTTT